MLDLDAISQITIYIKDAGERVNEISLFQPLAKRASFDEEAKPIRDRKWNFEGNLPWTRFFVLKIKTFLYKRLPFAVPSRRSTPEAKLKTVLAILLSQEALREYFLKDSENRESFFHAIKNAARHFGYPELNISSSFDRSSPAAIAQALTTIAGKELSLIEDLEELNIQMAAIGQIERDEILFAILNHIRRPPLNSVLEVSSRETLALNLELQTVYAKYKVLELDPQSGTIAFSYAKDRATSSIHTKDNVRPGAKGAMNQRKVFDVERNELIGTYCGELISWRHVMEQILFILGEEKGCSLFEMAPQTADPTSVIFTSLFSWNEYDKILQQRQAVNVLHNKTLVLEGQKKATKLALYHLNIPFNAFNKFPVPGETDASMRDLNDETMLYLAGRLFRKIGVDFSELERLIETIDHCRKEEEFITSHETYLHQIDAFRKLKEKVISELAARQENLGALSLCALLSHKHLNGMDELLYIDCLSRELGLFHNKNCEHSIDRCAGANAADKAQWAFRRLTGRPFLPGVSHEIERALFKVIYSMYLVWEEPELNAALSTGFVGEKFFNNFIQKNPETTRYLIHWLKRHPEMYLGLSEYRN